MDVCYLSDERRSRSQMERWDEPFYCTSTDAPAANRTINRDTSVYLCGGRESLAVYLGGGNSHATIAIDQGTLAITVAVVSAKLKAVESTANLLAFRVKGIFSKNEERWTNLPTLGGSAETQSNSQYMAAIAMRKKEIIGAELKEWTFVQVHSAIVQPGNAAHERQPNRITNRSTLTFSELSQHLHDLEWGRRR